MKKTKLILILISMFILLTGCNNDDDFYSRNAITGFEVTEQPEAEYLVYFYQPKCSHCIEFKPTMEQYEKMENSLKLYKVDLSLPSEQTTWYEYNISGTPTIFHIKNKEIVQELIGIQKLEDIPTSEK